MTMSHQPSRYADRIVQDPAILSGKPVVRGTRIPVDVVLEYLAHNPNFDELFADYPRLTTDDVKACFTFSQRLVEATPKPQQVAAPTPL
ncbi:MAG: DUF433 domain-containing protein [Chloroflexota bacterium]|nr:DUF433 domain-containing protein [Chloroflexota bacterium]